MTLTHQIFRIAAAFRPMGLMLLILLFVVQVTAPHAAVSASATGGHAQLHEMADFSSKCPMLDANPVAIGDDGADPDRANDNGLHCVLSMCCFHDTVGSARLVVIGALLPGDRLIDRGEAPTSNIGSIQDRPPRRV